MHGTTSEQIADALRLQLGRWNLPESVMGISCAGTRSVSTGVSTFIPEILAPSHRLLAEVGLGKDRQIQDICRNRYAPTDSSAEGGCMVYGSGSIIIV